MVEGWFPAKQGRYENLVRRHGLNASRKMGQYWDSVVKKQDLGVSTSAHSTPLLLSRSPAVFMEAETRSRA